MKKTAFLLLVLISSLGCLAEGTLKWKLNLSFKTDTVWIGEFDILNEKMVDRTVGISMSKAGEYSLQEPCIIIIQVKNIENKDVKTYYIPAMPGEEVQITDKNDGRYDFGGSAFYKKFHKVDLYVEDLQKKSEDISDTYINYIKEHPGDEACAMMTSIALRGKNNKIKEAGQILSSQRFGIHMKPFIDYLQSQEKINRQFWISLYDFDEMEGKQNIEVYGIAVSDKTLEESCSGPMGGEIACFKEIIHGVPYNTGPFYFVVYKKASYYKDNHGIVFITSPEYSAYTKRDVNNRIPKFKEGTPVSKAEDGICYLLFKKPLYYYGYGSDCSDGKYYSSLLVKKTPALVEYKAKREAELKKFMENQEKEKENGINQNIQFNLPE